MRAAKPSITTLTACSFHLAHSGYNLSNRFEAFLDFIPGGFESFYVLDDRVLRVHIPQHNSHLSYDVFDAINALTGRLLCIAFVKVSGPECSHCRFILEREIFYYFISLLMAPQENTL